MRDDARVGVRVAAVVDDDDLVAVARPVEAGERLEAVRELRACARAWG